MTASNETQEQIGGTSSTSRRWLNYKAGINDAGDLEIKEMIHQSLRGAIYLTEGDNLTWDGEENLGQHWFHSTAETINLLTPVRTTIRNRTDRNRALKMLAVGLACALEKREGDRDEDFMAKAREFITARELEILRLYYFAAALVTVVVMTVTLTVISGSVGSLLHEFLIVALCGGAGAMISVSERFRSIKVERYSSRRFTAIGGFTRILFGFIFGAVFLLFHKAGIVLNVVTNQPFLLAAVALVAGFSERAIPEVLVQVEHQIATSKASKTSVDA